MNLPRQKPRQRLETSLLRLLRKQELLLSKRRWAELPEVYRAIRAIQLRLSDLPGAAASPNREALVAARESLRATAAKLEHATRIAGAERAGLGKAQSRLRQFRPGGSGNGKPKQLRVTA